MKGPAVIDTTCLIGLERVGRLDILQALFDPVIVPPSVAQEFGTPLPWLKVEAPTNHAFVSILKMLLDEGEAEAIALASELGHTIVLDDSQARAAARNLGAESHRDYRPASQGQARRHHPGRPPRD